MSSRKIVITGAAGLVGQNLIPRLENRNLGELVAIDKHPTNTEIFAVSTPTCASSTPTSQSPAPGRRSLSAARI